MRRVLGVGSWHASGFALPAGVHYPNRERGGRVRVLTDGGGGIVVTGNEIEPRATDELDRILAGLREAVRR